MGNVAVYKKGTTDFFSQGVGLLSDVVSSNLTQTVSSTGNVEQKLEVEYPIDGYLVSELVEGAILRVSVSTDKSDYGVFEIVDTLKDDSGIITVYGDPYYKRILRMSFDNGGVFNKFPSVQSALNAAKQNITGFPADFNLISNLSTSVDLSANTYDTFGTFLEALNSAVHGNIKYSLNSIQIYSALGKDITDITLRDDMNTSSVKITTDFSGIINKVIPVLPVLDKDGNTTDQTKVGTIVTSKYYNQFLDYWAGKVIQFDTQDLANTYFDRTNADRPVQTVEVDPIGLDDDFSTINIFDTIELYSTRLDYTDKLRVSEREFDTLAENVTSFKLGSSSVNIFNQINEQNDQIFNNVVKLTNAAISANGKGIDYFGQAQPSSPKEGDTWFWDDGTDFGIKQYTNGEWVDLASSKTAEKIANAVTDAVTQAKAHTDEVKQGLSTDIDTAKSQAASLASEAASQAYVYTDKVKQGLSTDISTAASQAASLANTAQQNAIDVASKSLGTYLVRLLAGTNIFKTTNSTTIQAQVWKAGQDITSTLDSASFSWKIAKDGADAISLTNDVKNITAKPSDFNSTGTYTVNVIIPVTDTTGTTRDQTFSDSVTIAKVADGVDGATGNGISKTTITYQLGTSATTAPIGTWISTVPTLVKGQYLWTRTVWMYTDGTSETGYTTSYIAKDGNNGNDGIAGKDGVGITGTTITYAKSTSGTAAPATGYTSTVPTVEAGNFLWTKTVWNYSDNTTETGYSVAKMGEKGADGKDGIPGKDGNGIASTSITYATSTSGTIAPTSGYTSTIPAVAKGSYLWQRTIYTFTNGTTKTSDIVTYFSKDGVNGIDGLDGGQGMIASPTKPTTGLLDGFLWLDTSQTYPVYYVYDSALKDFKIYQFNAKNINADQIKAKFVGTDRLSASQIIADDLHVKSANIDGKLTASQITVSSTNGSQTSLANFNLGEMSQTISDTKNAVNNLGQVNQLFNTEFSPDFLGWTTEYRWKNGVISDDYSFFKKEIYKVKSSNIMDYIIGNAGAIISEPLPYNESSGPVAASAYIGNAYNGGIANDGVVALRIFFYDANKNFIGISTGNTVVNSTSMTYVSDYMYPPSGTAYVALNLAYSGTKGIARISQPMMVFNSTSTGSYVPGNYNNNAALSQVKITADGISNFVRDSSGNISSNFQTALSKTSIITGSDFATSIQKQTATQISSALTDNNGKIISLINQDTSGVQIAGKNITLDGNTTFTSLQQTVNDLGQVNQLFNTEFSPDFSGWSKEGYINSVNDYMSIYNYKYRQSNIIKIDTSKTSLRIIGGLISISSATVVSFSGVAKVDTNYAGAVAIRASFYDVNKNWIANSSGSTVTNSTSMTYLSQNNVLAPSNAAYVTLSVSFSANTGFVYISQPMLVFSSTVGTYVQGNYNNNAALAQVKITADSIDKFVRDSSGNISSDFQTAFSKTSIITGSTLATSIQQQTATQITSALTDNNGKIISLINQDTSGVQIAGKNIVLNGDTTVTGAFKVSQANIANGAIGTAQIGDAAITNAKIADLDVSKITGNVTNFIQSYWNGVYGSTAMNANGLSVQSGSMTTLFDSSGAHFAQGTRTAQYSFGNWIDNTGAATSAVGLYMGLRGDNNSFLDIVGPSGAAVAVIAGSDMADGANTNNVRGAINLFADTNIRSKLLFKGNDTVTSTYIEANEINRTMNFYTDDAKNGNGNWFWFNHKVLSEGTFSSTSLLSKKNVIADYEEDALGEISKTDIVEFEYKNNVGEKHISPIIDDVNDEKDYYIPKTILGENSQYVDMYSMISMAWKAIKQLNEKIGDK